MFTAVVNELSSGLYLATLTDETGTPVVGSLLQTATLSLYEDAGKALINAWDKKDILDPANGWTFYDALQSIVINGVTKTYNVAWQLAPGDNAIVDPTLSIEPHTAELQATWASGTKQVTHRFRLGVRNFETLP